MARTFKAPWICDRNPRRKNYANRRLRRIQWHKEIADGGSYRKYSDQWDICDWRWLVQPLERKWEKEDQRDFVNLWWAKFLERHPDYRPRHRRRELRQRKMLTGNRRAHRGRQRCGRGKRGGSMRKG